MVNKVTLEQAEQLVAQLTPQEQIKLIACISEWLSKMILSKAAEDSWRQDYATRIEAFLKMSDEMAAETIGEVDSAEDIRQLREERTSRL
ncbi:MAG: hypothetical protein ACE5PV_12575 [Candidatus Poribacteria bacterium]